MEIEADIIVETLMEREERKYGNVIASGNRPVRNVFVVNAIIVIIIRLFRQMYSRTLNFAVNNSLILLFRALYDKVYGSPIFEIRYDTM